MKMQLSVPLFSIIYFILSWIFIGCFIFFTVYHAAYKNYYKSAELNLPGYSPLGQEEDDDQDEDLMILLKGGKDLGKNLHQRIIGDKMADK